jgi:tetratricopeptide (TPR) repeat protein
LFAHHVVREAVYAEVSTPRRRMMHARVARVLADRLGGDDAAAADLAYHAGLAGEPGLAARACVRAGRHCLRVFANADAEAFARRGLRHAEAVPEPARVQCMLELHEVGLGARRPPQAEDAARTIEALAERAFAHGCLEHARLGFHMVSYLRWEGGAWSDAQRSMLRAEQVSRAAGDREHAVGMAEAARCLALLERDLPQAEALLLEAGALSDRLGIEPAVIPDAVGMLRLHAGRLDDAAPLFERALTLARAAADHGDEFRALEHLVMVELQRQQYSRALARCAELGTIGDRLREGSEAPFARTLTALARYALAEPDALAELERALAALRVADAKHRLAYALTQAARVEVERGTLDLARAHAEEALRVAQQLQRPSETALAHVVLARVATCRGDAAERARHLAALDAPTVRGVSADVRQAVDRMRTEQGRTPRARRAR